MEKTPSVVVAGGVFVFAQSYLNRATISFDHLSVMNALGGNEWAGSV
jgi:hypothetical protein